MAEWTAREGLSSLTTPALPPLERTGLSSTSLLGVSVGSDRSARSLDVATLVGTMQVIGEDLRLEQVITRVLASAIENAGADRGWGRARARVMSSTWAANPREHASVGE